MSQICSFITDATPISCPSIPLSVAEIRTPTFRSTFDFAGLSEAKLSAYVSSSVTGTYSGSVSFQWSHDTVTWNWFASTVAQPGISFNSTGAKVSSWTPITGSLTGSVSGSDVWIRPVTTNGDGLTTVWFNTLVLQAR